MKKSILIIATTLVSFLPVNAKNDISKAPSLNNGFEIIADHLVQIYEWTVQTDQAYYSGTSTSSAHAIKMIALTSTGEVLLEKKVESFYLLKEDLNLNSKRVYLWEVVSTNGHAQGFSTSENTAQKMIALVANGEIITSKIIKSFLLK